MEILGKNDLEKLQYMLSEETDRIIEENDRILIQNDKIIEQNDKIIHLLEIIAGKKPNLI